MMTLHNLEGLLSLRVGRRRAWNRTAAALNTTQTATTAVRRTLPNIPWLHDQAIMHDRASCRRRAGDEGCAQKDERLKESCGRTFPKTLSLS